MFRSLTKICFVGLYYCIFRKSICFVGVQSAAVNVICELARKNPKNYLSLAPLFFKLMTSSTNNWVLIKIIKLVGTRLQHHTIPKKKKISKKNSKIHEENL